VRGASNDRTIDRTRRDNRSRRDGRSARAASSARITLVNRLTKILVYDYSDRFAAGQVIATFHDSYALLAKTARITAF
jgi:hypothetical protein